MQLKRKSTLVLFLRSPVQNYQLRENRENSAVYGKAGAVYGKAGAVYGKAGAVYGKAGAVYGKAGAVYGKAGTWK
jgi:hypothetical protein